MNTIPVGQIERRTQQRVVALFRGPLGYDYLGDWTEREGNSNIERGLVQDWLRRQGVDDALIGRALYQLEKAAGDTSKSLYDRNRAVYELLRYGVKVKSEVGEVTQTVWLVDWKQPENNHFAIAEEVAVAAPDPHASDKRPDIVVYVNGIALAVLELKRSTVSVSEGIRQNLDNQRPMFIEPFFSTVQWVMAGNDTQGLRYGTIQTLAKYFLEWREEDDDGDPTASPLDHALSCLFPKARFLELVHDFTAFDSGTKKLCRYSQYFGVRAAQEFVRRHEGGIIWHTQGSGKSLVMVWLAKWIRENVPDSRVLIITDRTELDEQIEKVFYGVDEKIYRTKSGADLIAKLNVAAPWLLCSLVHKFGRKGDAEKDGESAEDVKDFVEEVKKALPLGFKVKGDLFVFVDECHRTQSGLLHQAMEVILPGATFIGFTGTPLLKADKQKSIEVFGPYIHTYKFDQAVRDGVVLDLRYEARDVDQRISSPAKIDAWFESKTQGLNDLARAELKKRWGTMQKVLSSKSRLEMIVNDIVMDFSSRDRLSNGRGNALLVSGSIYQACKYYELFSQTPLKGHCAIITSYKPTAASVKGEGTGEGVTERLAQYDTYAEMLAHWFHERPETAVNRIDEFEADVKRKFIRDPGQMKLLIVVDKLLTGFDAPPATYLYIDKEMRDHGLFQAICRVNRLDGEDKEYGYIVDYKDLFKSLAGAVHDYTSGALDGYDREDVAGLLEDRLAKARERLEETREAVKALCEPVEPPRDSPAFLRYFVGTTTRESDVLKANEPKRLALYQHVAAFIRAYANIANELGAAGYSSSDIATLKDEVDHFESMRREVKLASGDYIDLKVYEPDMRHLIDAYLRAEDSRKLSVFDDQSLVQLIVERGREALDLLPVGLRTSREAMAETIENNVRKLIIDEHPINPKYYDKMSELLEALVLQRRTEALDYEEYLKRILDLARQATTPGSGASYPTTINTAAKKALYDNLDRDEELALAVDEAIRANRQDDWRGNPLKVKKVKFAIRQAIEAVFARRLIPKAAQTAASEDSPPYVAGRDEPLDELVERLLELAKAQPDYFA